jgi:hypothetical protein
MKTMRPIQATMLTLILLAGYPVRSQQGSAPAVSPAHTPFGPTNPIDPNPLSPDQQDKIVRTQQTERQKKLIADTDHLLALATQLKADMDKTTKDTMSIEVIKKAEEIEKLAHSVKERMKS